MDNTTACTSSRGSSPSDSYLSPVVARLVQEHNLDPMLVPGTGSNGRVTKRDVELAVATQAIAKPPRPVTVVPLSSQRRRIASNLRSSVDSAVHALLVTEVDYTKVAAVRGSLSYLPFVARAVVDSLKSFPHLNAELIEDCLHLHSDVALGVAVDVNFESLVVPVVKDADSLRLKALASRVADLAHAAREKTLQVADLQGGSFTLTNVGQYGTVMAYPVLNPPQVAILSVDGVKPKPVAVEVNGSYAVAVHPMGNLSLAFDHRAVDGAYAASFLAMVRTILESRDWEMEL